MAKLAKAEVRVGCCGFPIARSAYFREFTLVEVQQTFYQPPQSRTLRRWREQARPRFKFSMKAWQLITHTPASPTYRRLRVPPPANKRDHYGAFRPTEEVEQAWRVTLEAAYALAAGLIVFQCPASFAPEPGHIRDLKRFFARAHAEAGRLRLAWEPRGHWPAARVEQLCRQLDLIPIVDPFKQPPIADLPHYFRLHGITGYRYRYSDADLEQLLGWCDGGALLFVQQHEHG